MASARPKVGKWHLLRTIARLVALVGLAAVPLGCSPGAAKTANSSAAPEVQFAIPVLRSVIDHEDFIFVPGQTLVGKTLKRSFQKIRAIKCRNDNADGRWRLRNRDGRLPSGQAGELPQRPPGRAGAALIDKS